MKNVLNWLENLIPEPTAAGDKPQFANFLDNAFPNPFNPTTVVKYGIKERSHVTLRVYNVAGQLVKTLVDEPQTPRAGGFAVKWKGDNDAGNPVASSVYFYKLVTAGFSQTKKMVLLK